MVWKITEKIRYIWLKAFEKKIQLEKLLKSIN